MNLYLLRHGSTTNNVMGITQDVKNDILLTKAAAAELEQNVGKMCDKLHSNVYIFCSPMARAKQTCVALHKALEDRNHDTYVQMLDDLKEVDFGDFGGKPEGIVIDGMSMQDYRDHVMTYYASDVYFSFPNGENAVEIHNRCVNALLDIAERLNFDGDIVIVGHNRLFRHLLVELGIWNYVDMFDAKLPHAELVQIDVERLRDFSIHNTKQNNNVDELIAIHEAEQLK